ncbi:MAG: lytic transglycosylase domain-containing protein, partial [Sphingomonadaceae bacterium]|nr:lytic transglycosylase domain-containing protein [Sphingomonadaceae bacterium]
MKLLLHPARMLRISAAMTAAKPDFPPDRDARPSLSSIARWAVASLALAAAPAAAQDLLGAQPTRSLTTPSSAGLASAIAEWSALRQTESLPFASYASFLTAHPGWPGEAALRKTAERALRPDSVLPMQVIGFFRQFPPQTPTAWLRYAEALDATGQRSAARDAARRAWTGGALSIDDETQLVSRFSDALSREDQDARMERLLWSRSTGPAARQLSLTSALRRPLYDT